MSFNVELFSMLFQLSFKEKLWTFSRWIGFQITNGDFHSWHSTKKNHNYSLALIKRKSKNVMNEISFVLVLLGFFNNEDMYMRCSYAVLGLCFGVLFSRLKYNWLKRGLKVKSNYNVVIASPLWLNIIQYQWINLTGRLPPFF